MNAVLVDGPYQDQLRVLGAHERDELRVPVPAKVAVCRPGDALEPADVQIEVGTYRPTDDDWVDASGVAHKVYRWDGPDRLFMCTRAGCRRRREHVAWRKFCASCGERTVPLP